MSVIHARQPPRWRSIAFLGSAVRWTAWYDTKIPFCLACLYYACLTRPTLEGSAIGQMAGVFVVLCLLAAFGYAVNSLSDRRVDRVAEKPNVLALAPARQGKAFVGAIAAACIAIAVATRPGPMALALLALALALAAFYSLPPIRFKERGVLGLVVPAAAQRTLPAAFAFSALDGWSWTAGALCILATLIGLRFIVVHQVLDLDADRRAGVRTAAVVHGPAAMQWLLARVVFPLECVTLGIALAMMSVELAVVAATVGVVFLWSLLRFARGVGPTLESYDLLEPVYSLWLPLVLAAGLAFRSDVFWLVFVFTLLWVFRRIRIHTRPLRRLLAARPIGVAASFRMSLPRARASVATVERAVALGVSALASMQQRDGSFPALERVEGGAWRAAPPLFATQSVLLAAASVLPAEVRSRATAFVAGERLDSGVWMYGPDTGLPPDSDVTACGLVALARQDSDSVNPDDGALLRSFWRSEDGPFRTWLVDDGPFSGPDRDDPVVNCNVLLALRAVSATPTPAELDAVARFVTGYVGRPPYYCSRTTIAYAARRAGLSLGALPPALQVRPGPWMGLLPTAQWLSAMERFDARAVGRVLAAQAPDGSWGIEGWYQTGRARGPIWGSPAISTALCVEGLRAAITHPVA